MQKLEHLIFEFFSKKTDTFIKEILNEHFAVKNYWYRYEFQDKGSPHIHGLLWLNGAPPITETNKDENEQVIRKYKEFYDNLMSAEIPDLNVQFDRHPSLKNYIDVEDTVEGHKKDLSELLVGCQLHRCSDYCKRVNRSTNVTECRFGFPKEIQEESKLIYG